MDKFKGNAAHEAKITERPPSPPRASLQGGTDDLDIDSLIGRGYAGSYGVNSRLSTIGRTTDGAADALSCSCGYSCGTETALRRHLERFAGDSKHAFH